MCEATYDYETDTYPAVEQLESMAAQLLQKEASVFLPSGSLSI
jgi:threonine aldolase